MRRRSVPHDPSRVWVRLPNWLGDLLMSRPAVAALRRALPAAELRAATRGTLVPLAEWDGTFDRVEGWPERGAERAAWLAGVRAWRPDAALVLPPSFSSAWWAWRSGAPRRIGFRSELRGPLLSHALSRPARGELHLSEEYRSLAAVLGAQAAPPPPLRIPEAARAAAQALLAGGDAGGRYALLGPGAVFGPAKRWDAGRFAAVGRSLAASGLAILVCGAASERDVCARVAGEVGSGARTLAGSTDLPALAGLCAGAHVAVCNDSGLAHLSAAVGAPTVVVFGSTSSAWTAPLGPRVRIVQRAPVCSPCFRRTCRIGYRCLDAVTPEAVLAACAEVAA